MKISINDARFFDREAFNGNVFVEKKDNKGFNALLVNCISEHYKTKLKGATRVYLVIEGDGYFVLNGKEDTAGRDDLFVISDGDVYEYRGKMKLFEFNLPATDSSNEEKL